jgi:hypothetical protein
VDLLKTVCLASPAIGFESQFISMLLHGKSEQMVKSRYWRCLCGSRQSHAVNSKGNFGI